MIDNETTKTRQIESFILNDAYVLPNSMTVLDRGLRYFQLASENISDPLSIAEYDWHYEVANGQLRLSDQFFKRLLFSNESAILICGPGFYNYGHFLYDGLPSVFLHRDLLGNSVKIVGPELKPWQKEIMELLGIFEHYNSINFPTRFKKLIVSSMLSLHVSYPTRFSRVVFDTIRFKVGETGSPRPKKVFISRGESNKRRLRNRKEVEGVLLSKGFEIIYPDLMSIKQQCTAFSSANFVVGEAGAGMGNIGFCDPGSIVLEILPFDDQWTRGSCFLMGHRWQGYFPAVRSDSSYLVDCQDLVRVIDLLLT